MAEFRGKKRKKVCQMCAGHDVDYKDVETIKRYNIQIGINILKAISKLS